jgi:hypothetical protein
MWMILVSGCAGVLDLGRATPLAPGEAEAHAGAAVIVAGDNSPPLYPSAGFGVRAGLVPRVDVGASIAVASLAARAGVDAKFALTDPYLHGAHLAVVPKIGVGAVNLPDYAPLPDARLGLLLGLDIAERAQFVLAPDVGWSVPKGLFGEVGIGAVIPAGAVDLVPAASVVIIANDERLSLAGSTGLNMLVPLR